MRSTPPSTCSQIAHTARPSSPAHSPTLPATTPSPSRTWTSPLFASTATGKASNDPQRRPHPPRHPLGGIMTTDPFTDAARAEAEVQCGNSFDLEHFMAGAEWARDHLAAQEPTDAEVEAAARGLHAALEAVHGTAWDDLGKAHRNRWYDLARAAVSAARAARRRGER